MRTLLLNKYIGKTERNHLLFKLWNRHWYKVNDLFTILNYETDTENLEYLLKAMILYNRRPLDTQNNAFLSATWIPFPRSLPPWRIKQQLTLSLEPRMVVAVSTIIMRARLPGLQSSFSSWPMMTAKASTRICVSIPCSLLHFSPTIAKGPGHSHQSSETMQENFRLKLCLINEVPSSLPAALGSQFLLCGFVWVFFSASNMTTFPRIYLVIKLFQCRTLHRKTWPLPKDLFGYKAITM